MRICHRRFPAADTASRPPIATPRPYITSTASHNFTEGEGVLKETAVRYPCLGAWCVPNCGRQVTLLGAFVMCSVPAHSFFFISINILLRGIWVLCLVSTVCTY